MSNRIDRDYLNWRHIDYRPVVGELLPDRLLTVLKPGQRVLEIGCGTGAVAIALAKRGMKVHGVDLNVGAIDSARRRAMVEGLSSRVDFSAVDFIGDEIFGWSADAVVLIRVLTCFADGPGWRAVVARAKRCVAPAGYLYVYDFLVSPETYGRRYDQGVSRGWRFGSFSVPNDSETYQFVAHHHTEAEVLEIAEPFTVIARSEHQGLSMHGTQCQMFELLCQRTGT